MSKASKNKSRKITAGGFMNQPAGGNSILLTQAVRWKTDISNYMRAVTEAERVDFPNRVRLYDLYDTAMLDTHLSSVLEKRKSAILSSGIEFSRNGKPDEKIGELLSSPWFLEFLSDLLDTVWWGHSLFQFEPDKDGWLSYNLIPRKHVDPIRRIIHRMQSDIHGVSWDEYDRLLSVGKPHALGELIKDIPWTLYKRGDVADWAQFAELFGQPIREYIYNPTDDEARSSLMNDIYEGGGSSVYMHPEGSNMTLLEAGNKTGSSDLYKGLADFCNAEMSKHVLGNTLTTEAGNKGTQALGTVHQKVEDRLQTQDKLFVLNVLNYQMTDLFESFGIRVHGGKFAFITPKDTNLTQRILIDTQIAEQGVPISHDYWYETYGIPKPDNYDILMAEKEQTEPKKETGTDFPENGKRAKEKPQKKEKPSLINRLTSFFGMAPESRKGADTLEW